MTSPDAPTWRVRASAKVNLTLRVLGMRADGYHELRTTFQSLAMHDTLTLVRTRGPFAITSNDPRCPTDTSNLVWKAAAALWSASGRPRPLAGVRVHVSKRIPMEAGLGGGSSDAAATLLALREVWGLRVSDSDLAALGRTLGADVPFFLDGGTALGVERGDLLFPLADAPPAWVVIARPDFGISTKDAYGWWDQANLAPDRATPARSLPQRTGTTAVITRAPRVGSRRLSTPAVSRHSESIGSWHVVERGNDLQGPVEARHPQISNLINGLTRFGSTLAAMSGSGSAVFGLFDDRQDAEKAAARLSSPTVTTWRTRTTTRRQHLRASAPQRVR